MNVPRWIKRLIQQLWRVLHSCWEGAKTTCSFTVRLLRVLFRIALRGLKKGAWGCAVLLLIFIGMVVLSSVTITALDAAKSFLTHYCLPLFLIFLLVSLPFIFRWLRPYRDVSKTVPVLLLAILYAEIILIFSVLYYSLYLCDASAITFSGALEDKQATGYFASRYSQIQKHQRHLYNIALWKQWLLSHSDVDFSKARAASFSDMPLPSTVTNLMFQFAPGHQLSLVAWLPKDTVVYIYYVVFVDGKDYFVSQSPSHLFHPFPAEMEIVEATNRLQQAKALLVLEEKLNDDIRRILAEIRGSSRDWPLWGYLEFVYFSACVSTTASYGDITPNSGLVRFLTTLQVITSLFLFTFGIKMFLSSRPAAGKGEADRRC